MPDKLRAQEKQQQQQMPKFKENLILNWGKILKQILYRILGIFFSILSSLWKPAQLTIILIMSSRRPDDDSVEKTQVLELQCGGKLFKWEGRFPVSGKNLMCMLSF